MTKTLTEKVIKTQYGLVHEADGLWFGPDSLYDNREYAESELEEDKTSYPTLAQKIVVVKTIIEE